MAKKFDISIVTFPEDNCCLKIVARSDVFIIRIFIQPLIRQSVGTS